MVWWFCDAVSWSSIATSSSSGVGLERSVLFCFRVCKKVSITESNKTSMPGMRWPGASKSLIISRELEAITVEPDDCFSDSELRKSVPNGYVIAVAPKMSWNNVRRESLEEASMECAAFPSEKTSPISSPKRTTWCDLLIPTRLNNALPGANEDETGEIPRCTTFDIAKGTVRVFRGLLDIG